MAEVIEKILDIKVDHSTAIKKLGEYNAELARTKEYEKELKKMYSEGKLSLKEYTENVSAAKIQQQQYSEAIRVLNKEVQNEIKSEGEARTSLKGMRAELSNLVAQYDSLTKAQRESADGKAMQEHIASLTREIKDNEYATERYWRNVGNYPQQLKVAFMDAYASTGKLSAGFAAAGQSASAFGKQMLKLLANPFVAAFAAIAAVIMGIAKAFRQSEDQTARLQAVFAAFTPIVNGIKNVFTAMAEVVLKVAEGFVYLAEKIGLVGEASKETIAIEQQRIALAREERENLVAQADTENKVAKLRDKVAQKDKYTAAERKRYLQEAIALEEEQSRKNKALAEARLKNLEREAKLTANDAEMNQKLAEAKAAVTRADTEYYNTTRRMQQQLATFNQQEQQEAQKSAEAVKRAAEEKRKAREEAKQKELAAVQAAEDAMLELVADVYEKEVLLAQKKYDREISALRLRLETEKDLTATARDAIISTIEAKEQEKANVLAAIEAKQVEQMDKANEQITQHEAQLRAKRLALAIEAAKKDSYEELQAKRDANIAAYEQQLADIDKELADDEWKYEQKALALEAYLQKQNDLTRQYSEQNAEQQKAIAEREMEIQKAKTDFAASTLQNLSQLMAAFGDNNKAMAKLSKILALGEIAVNTGKALAAGVAQAQSVPFPANIAAIATTTATILANITAAISTVKSAKFAHGGRVDVQQYATGGAVSGPGTGTSDSIPARLSNGESVMTAAATNLFSPMLSAFNQMGGGVPINVADTGSQAMGEEMLARAVARGVAAMPAPVVSVEEINRTGNRVRVIEDLASL